MSIECRKWDESGTKLIVRRLISSLRDKEYINVKIIYKENSKEILKRVLTPINKCVNTYKQFRTSPINTDVKDILKNNNINYNNRTYDYQRDYSNYDFTKLYVNNF